MASNESEQYKRQAAEYAAGLVLPGMAVGLGVGSTAIYAVRRLAELYHAGTLRDIICVPCSIATEQAARELGLPLTTLEAHPTLDITIDGADEVDPHMNLVKGGGGALLREKIVAQASAREVIAVDTSKLSPALGTIWPLPVEVVPFGHGSQERFLEQLGARPALRHQDNGELFITDQGNYIYDCDFGPLADPRATARALEGKAGIVEHGLFLGLATDLVVGGPGGVRHRRSGEESG